MSNPKRMSYKEFVEKLKTGHVYTHSGGMHADDVLSTALINKVCDKEGIERPVVHRIFDKNQAIEMGAENIVYDIGMGEFDHHQKDNEVRDDGTPYASFGKIFEVVGQELFGEYADQLNERFVKEIDLCDNTEKNNPYSMMISGMNPNWNESFSLNEAFDNAVRIAEQGLDERIEAIDRGIGYEALTELITSLEEDITETRTQAKELASIEADEVINQSIMNKESVTIGDKTFSMIHFDRPGIPYPTIKAAVEGTDIAGYTFPARGSVTYKPLDRDECTLSIPERWKGAQEFDVDGLTFCHASGISMSFNNIESCFKGFEVMVKEQEALKLNDICAQASEGYEEYSNQENNTNVAANTQNSDDGQNISSNVIPNIKEDFNGADEEGLDDL